MLKATISGKPNSITFKVICCLAIFIILIIASQTFAADDYNLIFSTYFGGSDWEHARDVVVDESGNIYVVGGTASADFPTTSGAYSQSLQTGGSQQFGPCDIFIVKLAPDGTLLWSTLVGGPNYDRAYGVEVDGQGYIYVAGRAGPDFPVKNAFQPDFDGVDNGSYGMQNAFVLKLMPDGSDLVWSSYVGVSTLCRDIAIDQNGDVYVPGGRWNTSKTPPAEWFENAYQKEPPGGVADCGVIKIKSDGSRVLWATWLGGSAQDNSAASIRVGSDGRIYIGGSTFSADFPTTAGAYDSMYSGEADFFVACLTPDGSDLVYGTYLGGPGNEWISTHNLAVDNFGNAYVAIPTSSPNYQVTEGAFQQTFRGGNTDWAITKLSPTGALLASTLLGGSDSENPDGIYIGTDGQVFITGETQSADFPVTTGAYQNQKNAGTEAVLVMLSSDLKNLLYATYLGGGANDNGRSGCLGADGSLYITGASNGPGWPAKNAYQSTFVGGGGDYGNGDCILGKLSPATTITIDPSETFQTISGWEMVAFALEPDNPAFPNFKDELFNLAVHDVGINRLRLEIRSGSENTDDNWSGYQNGTIDYQTWRSRRYATVNDNADPYTINWNGFHFSEMDDVIERIVNPLRTVLEADGDKLYVNINYVAFTGQIQGGSYIHDDPVEYAEFVLATYLHIQEKYGWFPDSWEVLLEPDNVTQWNGTLLGRAIVATAERLRAAGFEPVFIVPSNTNMGNAITYFDRMVEVPGAVEHLREFSYHRYGGVSLQNLRTIAKRAQQYGLDTSMLEWWSTSNSYRTLHEDLKVGKNSAWQQGVLVGALNSNMALYVVDDSNPANPRLMLNNKTKFTRQYYRFIRPGALRIGAESRESTFDPLAFINKNGGYTVVLKCDAGGDFSIGGLAAGTYGIKYTTSSQYDVDLPDQTISAGGAVLTGIPATGVLTVYGKPAPADDQPPTVPAGLIVTDLATSQLILTWEKSMDDAAVAGYKIYRDGILLGFSQTNSFVDKKVEPATDYTYEILVYDTALNESPLSASLQVKTPEPNIRAELIGYWKFEERRGTAATDISGSDNDGTLFGPKRIAMTNGFALEFDGRDDYVEIVANPDLNNLDAVTMSAWINPHVDGHWHVMDKGDGDKRIYAEGANRTLDGRIRYSGSHAYSQGVGGTIELNKWQHIAMTWSRATNRTRLYHNGAEVQYSTQEIGSGSVLDDTTYPFIIGARGALGDVTFFDGLMDEVRLYEYALTEQEIQDIFNSFAP